MSITPKLQDSAPRGFIETTDKSTGDVIIKLDNTYFLENAVIAKDSLMSSLNAGAYPIYTTSNLNLTNNGYYWVLIGDLGSKNSEILQVQAVYSQAGTKLVPQSSNLQNNHLKGDNIYILGYHSFTIARYDANKVYMGTSYLVQAKPTDAYTPYIIRNPAETYVKIGMTGTPDSSSIKSPYSELISLDYNQQYDVLDMFNSVRVTTGNNTNVGDSFLLEALNDARQLVKLKTNQGGVLDWRANYQYPLRIKAGTNYIDLPADIDYTYSTESLRHIQSPFAFMSKMQLRYVDKKDFNVYTSYIQTCLTTVQATTGATTIYVDNVSTLQNIAGTLAVSAEAIGDQIIYIRYTGVDYAANALTGVSGVTRTIPVGSQLTWTTLNAYPQVYTVYNGKIYFNTIFPQAVHNKAILIDYYRDLEPITTVQQNLNEPFKPLYKYYLKYAIARRRNDQEGANNPDFQIFNAGVEAYISKSYNGQFVRIT